MIKPIHCPKPYLYIVMLGYDFVLPPNVKTDPGLLLCFATEVNDCTIKEVPSLAATVIALVIQVEVKQRTDLGLVADPC